MKHVDSLDLMSYPSFEYKIQGLSGGYRDDGGSLGYMVFLYSEIQGV